MTAVDDRPTRAEAARDLAECGLLLDPMQAPADGPADPWQTEAHDDSGWLT